MSNVTLEITRQRKNCGPTQSIIRHSHEEAQRAFDIAVAAGDVFAEIFDINTDTQVCFHLASMNWVRY